MKKLITGGTGLVGSSFKQDENTIAINSFFDLRDNAVVEKLFDTHKPEIVVHAAARVGGLKANINYPAEFFVDNVRMNTNVIDNCYKFGVKKLVVFSSSCIFSEKIEYPFTENNIHEGQPHESMFAYAYSKRMVDIQLKAFNKQYKTRYFSVIPSNVYGPNDNFNLENGTSIPVLIHRCYLAKVNNTPFTVWGTGSSLREYIYSRDIADIVDKLIYEYQDSSPIIISNKTEYSIRQVVDLIVRLMNFEGDVIWDKTKPEGQLRKPTDNSKLIKVIGDYKFTSLEQGLSETIEWFTKNYNTIRK